MKQSRKIFNSETLVGIGARIREIRGERTLAEYAEKLGVGRSTLSNYEAGRRQPNYAFIEKLCELEGMRSDAILPNTGLEPLTVPMEKDNWWAYIPALWLFSHLQQTHKFEDPQKNLVWWSKHFPTLIDEAERRVFDLADKADLELSDAALEICSLWSDDDPDELFKLVMDLQEK